MPPLLLLLLPPNRLILSANALLNPTADMQV
jgi:hypothetical protein